MTASERLRYVFSFLTGGLVGMLGGLIGLGGAEFRLPVLIDGFGFAALEAVILKKSMSLVVVASALPFRDAAVPLADVASHWPFILNLLAGSLFGAWLGASWAVRMNPAPLHRVIAVLLIVIALVLVTAHDTVLTSHCRPALLRSSVVPLLASA
jgi:uncharacterized membrane protein YfcA